MRHALAVLFALCLLLSGAGAEESPQSAMAVIVDQVMALNLGNAEFTETGPWLSVRLTDGLQTHGRVYDLATGAPVTWADLFVDADTAEAALLARMEKAASDNTYAEKNDLTPVPRDSFTVREGVLTLYYPQTQFAHFSGRSGAFAFYAYEVADLLKPGVPLAPLSPSLAREGLAETLAAGVLPGPLSRFAVGAAMAEADAAWGVVDVPDLTHTHAVYAFEAPEARAAAFLAEKEQDDVENATIAGIQSRAVDFYGCRPGVSTRADCVAILGEPDEARTVSDADAYSRLPVGETLVWRGETHWLELHFSQGLLWSVAVMGNYSQPT